MKKEQHKQTKQCYTVTGNKSRDRKEDARENNKNKEHITTVKKVTDTQYRNISGGNAKPQSTNQYEKQRKYERRENKKHMSRNHNNITPKSVEGPEVRNHLR